LNDPNRMMRRLGPVALWLLAAVGCDSRALDPTSDGGHLGGPACNGPASSTLPGVSLTFPDACRTYTQAEVAAGIELHYQVVVAADVAGLHPVAGDAGYCAQPGDSGLIVQFVIAGNEQSYCLCDTGRCFQQSFSTAPRAGTYPATISWDGRNWTGPSDFGNPEGAPFPPGTYTLTLSARGTRETSGGATDYLVSATRSITITP
jgi:hypothetical protein